jgi:transcriptional regulatory protein RtcR
VEIAYLKATWSVAAHPGAPGLIDEMVPPPTLALLDRFDRVQLEEVVQVCRRSPSLSAAGRVLFDRSRQRKKMANDADRLRKYLARFGLEWSDLKERAR